MFQPDSRKNQDFSNNPNILMIMKILWFGLFGFLILFGFVLNIVIQPEANLETLAPSNSPLMQIFPIMGLVFFVLGLVLPKSLALVAISKKRQQIVESKNPEITKTNLLFPFYLFRLVAFETIGTLGFALAMTQRNPSLYLYFVPFALLGFVISFPTKEKLNKIFS